MQRLYRTLYAVLLGLAVAGLVSIDRAEAQGACSPPHRLRIVDLDMRPDPIPTGQPIENWRVTIKSDRNGECATSIQIYDQDQLAGFGDRIRIRPGKAVYTIQPSPNYRFRGRDNCFVVQANVGGVFTSLEAERKFCAKAFSMPMWTLREREEWPQRREREWGQVRGR